MFLGKTDIKVKFDNADTHKKNIEYIKSQLKIINPDVLKDFNQFLTKFNSVKVNESQYQDLIGFRSMMYLKLIFGFCEKNYGLAKGRKKQIMKFIFGSSPYDSAADPIVTIALNLYLELSNQDKKVSVKTGNVTEDYIKDLFRRIIDSLSSVLRLRAKYFKS